MIVYVIFLRSNIDENKNESFFINMIIKIKLNFFSHNKLKFQPRT